MELKDKRILIIGMALSGIAAAKVLYRHGAHIILNDIKEQCELGDALNQLEGIKAEYAFGAEPDELLERCGMAIVSPGVPLDKPFVKKACSLGIELIGEVEMAYRLSNVPIVAITGTNGKTTTTALTGHIFKLAGVNTFVCGNIGTPMISAIEQYGPGDVVVAEISSFQLESIRYFKPRVSAILNITEDHLNRHGTFDNYIAIKSRIFMNQGPDDHVVINMDNEPCRRLIKLPNAHVLPFSRKQELDEGVMVKDDYIICRLNSREDKICRVNDIKIPGKHNLENALASAAIAYAMGIGPDVIAQGLRTFEGVEHRIEFVDEIDGVRFINDSKGTNPDAAVKAIEAVDGPIILIAGGMDKHADFTGFIEAFDSKVKALVLLGETADQIASAARRMGFDNIYKVHSLQEAVEQAWHLSSAGDCVLLSPACASWDMFDNFEQRGMVFKEAVRKLRR